jgi:hypothetical protein
VRVGQLAAILDTLDPDTLVLIRGVHLQYISKDGARDWPVTVDRTEPCGGDGCRGRATHELRPVPPSIDFGHTIWSVGRTEPDPPVKLHGRWPRLAKQLEAACTEEGA